MNIAFDFDFTITEDPVMFASIIKLAESRGHRCYIVSWRENTPEEVGRVIDMIGEGVLPHYRVKLTNCVAKKYFMEQQGIEIDVWVDDDPAAILNGR